MSEEDDEIFENSNDQLVKLLSAIVINNNKDKEEKEKKSKQSTHFTKPRNPPDWTKNMK